MSWSREVDHHPKIRGRDSSNPHSAGLTPMTHTSSDSWILLSVVILLSRLAIMRYKINTSLQFPGYIARNVSVTKFIAPPPAECRSQHGTRSSSFLIFSRPLVTTHLKFSNRAISIHHCRSNYALPVFLNHH